MSTSFPIIVANPLSSFVSRSHQRNRPLGNYFERILFLHPSCGFQVWSFNAQSLFNQFLFSLSDVRRPYSITCQSFTEPSRFLLQRHSQEPLINNSLCESQPQPQPSLQKCSSELKDQNTTVSDHLISVHDSRKVQTLKVSTKVVFVGSQRIYLFHSSQ